MPRNKEDNTLVIHKKIRWWYHYYHHNGVKSTYICIYRFIMLDILWPNPCNIAIFIIQKYDGIWIDELDLTCEHLALNSCVYPTMAWFHRPSWKNSPSSSPRSKCQPSGACSAREVERRSKSEASACEKACGRNRCCGGSKMIKDRLSFGICWDVLVMFWDVFLDILWDIWIHDIAPIFVVQYLIKCQDCD